MANVLSRLFSVEALKGAVKRFPYSAYCVLGIFLVKAWRDLFIDQNEVFGRIAACCPQFYWDYFLVDVFGWLCWWFVVAKVISEGREFSAVRSHIFYLVSASILAVVFYYDYPVSYIPGLFSFLGLLLITSVSPFLAGENRQSFLRFNKNLWPRIILVLVITISFVEVFDWFLDEAWELFGWNKNGDVRDIIYSFFSIFPWSIYLLACVPKLEDTK